MMRRREALETRRRRVVREALRFFSACASSMIRWLHRHFSRKPRSRRCSGLRAAAGGVGWGGGPSGGWVAGGHEVVAGRRNKGRHAASQVQAAGKKAWPRRPQHRQHAAWPGTWAPTLRACQQLPCAPVALKQRVAGQHDVEGGGLQRRVDVPLGRRVLGLQLRVAPRLLLVNVKLVVCRGPGGGGPG